MKIKESLLGYIKVAASFNHLKLGTKYYFASDNIEVIEIGVPAEHVTTIDHEHDSFQTIL